MDGRGMEERGSKNNTVIDVRAGQHQLLTICVFPDDCVFDEGNITGTFCQTSVKTGTTYINIYQLTLPIVIVSWITNYKHC